MLAFFLAAALDWHSFSGGGQVRSRHIDLDLEVSFARRAVSGTATHTLDRLAPSNEFVLDTRGLAIHRVETSPDGSAFRETLYRLGAADPIRGAPLTVTLTPDARFVRIAYSTGPGSTGLKWAGNNYFYTQSWSIHARSWVPVQDSPGLKFTYSARVRVPEGMLALMSAENSPDAPRNGEFRFRMPQPVSPQLLALAVGDFAFRSLGPRTGVYARPAVIARAAEKCRDAERILAAAVALAGSYLWDRYDILVLPPGTPFGGMENPRLTFISEKAIGGKSPPEGLIAHELAHSWSGNLATNATWSDIWISEGITTYLGARIEETAFGRSTKESVRRMCQAVEKALPKLPDPDEALHPAAENRHPDKLLGVIPYQKGALLLFAIEQAAGREALDGFLRAYFEQFSFRSLTTEEFSAYLKEKLPAATAVPLEQWLREKGLPACPVLQ